MTDLKSLIDELDAPDDWDSILRRPSRTLADLTPPKRHRAEPGRRLGIAFVSLGLAALATVFLVRAFETRPPPPPPQAELVIREFELSPGIGHMEFAFGSLWVVATDGVIRVDPSSGEVVAEIPVEGITALGDSAPDWSGITSGAEKIWITAEPNIAGIDPQTNEIAQSFTYQSGVSRITFADGLIVVGGSAKGNGDISLIDPKTETNVDGGGLADPLTGFPSVLVTRDWYWAGGQSHGGGAALARRAKDGTAVEVIEGIASFDSFAAAGGFVWVTGGDRLYRVDDTYEGPAPSPQSVFPTEADAVSAEIAIEGPAQVASDGSTLWLLEGTEDGPPRLTQIDPVTGEDRSAPVTLARDGPVEMTVADGDAWISFRNSGLLVTLDAAPPNDATPDDDQTPTLTPTVTDEPERGTGPIRGAFYPAVYREGERIVMPVTFVDGTTAEVMFRGDLRANELGTYGEIAGGLGEVDRSIYFRYGTASQFEGSGPLGSYEGYGGSPVEEWEPPPDSFACPTLVFRFGDWFVGVRTCQDGLSTEEKAQWARLLGGRQTEDGFLVLDAEPPLTIAEAGEHAGPDLWLQGSDRGSPFITLRPGPCTLDGPARNQELRVMPDGQEVLIARIAGQVGTWYANWCEDGMMYVGVDSRDRDYVEAAAEGLRIRNITIAS